VTILEIFGLSFAILLKVILINIVLSGDNAVVIAMASRNVPKKQQKQAIFWGTFGAVILRVLFAVAIVYLLDVPFVTFIGGLLGTSKGRRGKFIFSRKNNHYCGCRHVS
jgi:predicted tellurium resistance membrane protein TerC